MNSLHQFQKSFAAGLLEGSVTTVDNGRVAGYAVHARNVRNSLVSALEQTFPVVRELVGAPFFAWTARHFIAAYPPLQPWLTSYGADFPAFLDRYQAAAKLPYLADLAELEWARVRAAFSNDEPGIDLATLAAAPASELIKRRHRLHDCATMIATRFPIYSIWAAHQHVDRLEELETITPEPVSDIVLISRSPSGEAIVSLFRSGRAIFLYATAHGIPLGSAWERALDDDPEFDLASALRDLVEVRALHATG